MTNVLAFPVSAPKEPRYINTTEIAKLIRKALKEAFPEIKFSVRSNSYSMGSSIDVVWMDGPLSSTVDAIARKFNGSSFDGMTDSKTSLRHVMAGEPVNFCVDYVFTKRDISREKMDRMVALVEKMSIDDREQAAFRYGIHSLFYNNFDDVRTVARQFLQACSPIDYSDRRSALAESVEMVAK